MGYQNITLTQGYHFFTVTFDDISDATQFKLSEVGCFQSDGTTWNDSKTTSKQCKGDIYLQKINTQGGYGDGVVGGEKVSYRYYGNTDKAEEKMGWFKGLRADDFSNKIIGDNDITFEPGEGWILYCGKDAAKIVLPKPIAGMSLDNATLSEGSWEVEHTAKDLTTDSDNYASLYAVIVSDDGKNYFIYDGYDPVLAEEAVVSGAANFSAEDDIVTGAQSSWTAIAAPEPTSGLLLLIGVAGLALKRRRA